MVGDARVGSFFNNTNGIVSLLDAFANPEFTEILNQEGTIEKLAEIADEHGIDTGSIEDDIYSRIIVESIKGVETSTNEETAIVSEQVYKSNTVIAKYFNLSSVLDNLKDITSEKTNTTTLNNTNLDDTMSREAGYSILSMATNGTDFSIEMHPTSRLDEISFDNKIIEQSKNYTNLASHSDSVALISSTNKILTNDFSQCQ